MSDPLPGAVLPAAPAPAAVPAAPKPAATPAPATPVQPTPAAKPGAPATPAPAQPPTMVPITALHDERDKRQALQGQVDQLQAAVQLMQRGAQPAAPAVPGFQQPVQQQPQFDVKARLDQLWKDDPRQAVQAELTLGLQWADNINNQVDSEAETLTAKYPDFNNYRGTAMRYVRSLPLEQRSKQGIVELAYLVTRGQNVDTAIAKVRQDMTTEFLNNPAQFQMPAGAGAAPFTPGSPVATDGEVRAAKAMNIPIEEYLKHKK